MSMHYYYNDPSFIVHSTDGEELTLDYQNTLLHFLNIFSPSGAESIFEINIVTSTLYNKEETSSYQQFVNSSDPIPGYIKNKLSKISYPNSSFEKKYDPKLVAEQLYSYLFNSQTEYFIYIVITNDDYPEMLEGLFKKKYDTIPLQIIFIHINELLNKLFKHFKVICPTNPYDHYLQKVENINDFPKPSPCSYHSNCKPGGSLCLLKFLRTKIYTIHAILNEYNVDVEGDYVCTLPEQSPQKKITHHYRTMYK
ncbi:hypothetical protein QTN25_007722 [Entamoeba marina]